VKVAQIVQGSKGSCQQRHRGTLSECADSGQAFIVELPGDRFVAIQPLDPGDDDSLVSELLASNAAFQALDAKSKAGPRKPFGGGSGS
jgi:hypothetical protein